MSYVRVGSNQSIGILSIVSERVTQRENKTKKCQLFLKISILLISFGIIIYLFIDYTNFNDLFPKKIYSKIIDNYDKINTYAKIIDYLSNYHIFILFFLFGFCQWNVYKSYIHFFGFFICEYIVFLLKTILRKYPLILNLEFNKKNLSDKSLSTLCEFTSDYECPSYRAAYVIYTYMSFITLLFKEKKLKNKKCIKFMLRIFFIIFSVAINASLILLLQDTISSIVMGSAIGFIIYFFMFSLLKIDYDRSEQMLSFLNVNIIFYILINVFFFFVMFFCNLFIKGNENQEKEKMQNLCGNTSYNYKKLYWETFFKNLFFYCNLTMIFCIKLQRKYIFKTDGYFVSRNFSVEEIIEPNNLLARITNEETNKFNKYFFFQYLCKVLICVGVALFVYLIFVIIKYYRGKYYALLSILAYSLPINLLIIFLFLFAKITFIYFNLEVYNDPE